MCVYNTCVYSILSVAGSDRGVTVLCGQYGGSRDRGDLRFPYSHTYQVYRTL